jgi:hypothetical protein
MDEDPKQTGLVWWKKTDRTNQFLNACCWQCRVLTLWLHNTGSEMWRRILE